MKETHQIGVGRLRLMLSADPDGLRMHRVLLISDADGGAQGSVLKETQLRTVPCAEPLITNGA